MIFKFIHIYLFKVIFLIKYVPLQQEFFERLYVMYTIGYSVSFGSLAVAIVIIGYFRWVIPNPFLHEGTGSVSYA